MSKIRSFAVGAGSLFFLILVFVCGSAGDAHAYIDPGSGSHFFQVLIAGLLAALYAIKVYWRRFTAFCKKLFKGNQN